MEFKITEDKFVKCGEKWCKADHYTLAAKIEGDPPRVMIKTSCCGDLSMSLLLFDEPIDKALLCPELAAASTNNDI